MAGRAFADFVWKLVFMGFLILMRCLVHALRYLAILGGRDTGKTTRESTKL
jgi:hypothetical protein